MLDSKNIKDQKQSLLKVLLAAHKSLLESSQLIEQKELIEFHLLLVIVILAILIMI